MFEVIEAKRENAPITAAFIGGSGSGKTYSALLFGRGLVGPEGKIVVIDAEGGRCKIYADDPDIGGFHWLELVEPFRSNRFRDAFKAAIKAGADVVIIDTISHEHEGFLEYADQEEAKGGRGISRSKWIKPKGDRKRFYSAISSSSAHVIVTIRLNRIVNMDVKPAVEIMKPECDKDLPYRMDLSLRLNPENHTAEYIRVPKPLIPFVENGVAIEKRHGEMLAKDINSQPKSDTQELDKVVASLEDAADSGGDTLKHAWEAAWRAAGPDNDTKTLTPLRNSMKAHLDRLKGLAAAADQQDDAENGDFGDMPDNNSPQDDDESGLFQTSERGELN